MKQRYRMYRKETGVYYAFDRHTGQRESLETNDRDEALELLLTKNQAHRQPTLNLHLARTYLRVGSPETLERTWQTVLEEIIKTKQGETKARWSRAAGDPAFTSLKNLTLFETRAEHFLRVLERGTVSTNVYLRRLHNFALDMSWLLAPVLPKKQWPTVRYQEKRAVTWDEHLRIIDREPNPERCAFYELAWHLGASQSDLANLHAEDIDWANRVISFHRLKLRFRNQPPVRISFGSYVEHLLRSLPRRGPLFPYLITVRPSDRATEFKQRCEGLGIRGVTLHSYRYAWAQRAKEAGYPERFAMEALGHNSKAVHRAYARNADFRLPALEEYERAGNGKIVALPAIAMANGVNDR
ncbi:MAG: tyrosine-type recombinase/integrase [Verrucomicrobia bacterium]|nr:tyrosine-type recombinase/integrase [Verrucomicrobiota bacterium]